MGEHAKHPWIKSYPSGISWDLEAPQGTVQQLLDDSASRYPDHPALTFMGRTLTYRELQALTDRMAVGLQKLGVGPGVHVGIYLPNTPHYVIAFFGILKAGGTAVNYSPLDAAKTLVHKVADSQTDYLFTLDLASLYPMVAGLPGNTRLKALIVGNLAEMSGDPEGVGKKMQDAGQIADVAWGEHNLRFADLLDNDGQYQRHAVADPADAIAVLQYTGGTTGEPKGAMLTHGNLTAACAQCWATAGGEPRVLEEGKERILAVLPPFHIYALTVNLLFGLRAAAEIFQHARFDPKTALNEIAERRITCFPAVPTMFAAMLEDPQLGDFDLTSLKFCGSGGAPLPVELGQRFTAVTGCSLNEGWGMTETSPTGTFTPVNGVRKSGSCGMPSPGIEVRILALDDNSRYLPPGEPGEMCVRGANVMKGYWNKPEATAEVTTFDGMLRTGDVAYMDEDGYVFIVDRTKDMILCSGFNVYPRNLEEAVYQHPSVAEVCVIGVPDDYRGQSPKAFVKLKAGAPAMTLEELQGFLKSRLGKHEMVYELEIRDELPKTAVGKLSRKDLADQEARKRATATA